MPLNMLHNPTEGMPYACYPGAGPHTPPPGEMLPMATGRGHSLPDLRSIPRPQRTSREHPCTRRHVALFLPSLEAGGAERVMLSLALGFADRGLAVDLVLVRAEGTYLAEVPPHVRIVDLGARRASRGILALVRYLRRERPAALVSTSSHANLVALLAKRLARVSTRVVLRQAETLSGREHSDGLGVLIPLLARYCYPWADVLVAGSEGVARDLTTAIGLARERIRVVPNPVVPTELPALASAPLDDPWFAAGSDPVVLGVGRLVREKDFPTLIRAFAKVRQQRPARLMILGEGSERASLETLVAEIGLQRAVSLPGFAPNPFRYMARAAVYVLSSSTEGLPGALVQALACGAPAVATDCDNGPREVLDGGRYGRLVPVGNVAALADAILSAIGEPTPPVPKEAWRQYSQDAAVEQYLRILEAGPRE